MPVDQAQFEFNRIHLVQLLILIFSLPLQYFFTSKSTEVVRQNEIKQVVDGLQNFLNVSSWFTWCGHFLGSFHKNPQTSSSAEIREDETIENVDVKEQNVNFGLSLEPRLSRPAHLRFHIGQVVKHRFRSFRGVVVGWDEIVKAPLEWQRRMRPENKPHWKNMPNYAVLVDTRDRLAPQVAYVVEENIELVDSSARILHPFLDTYFEDFDGRRYQPRPWLRKVYPSD